MKDGLLILFVLPVAFSFKIHSQQFHTGMNKLDFARHTVLHAVRSWLAFLKNLINPEASQMQPFGLVQASKTSKVQRLPRSCQKNRSSSQSELILSRYRNVTDGCNINNHVDRTFLYEWINLSQSASFTTRNTKRSNLRQWREVWLASARGTAQLASKVIQLGNGNGNWSTAEKKTGQSSRRGGPHKFHFRSLKIGYQHSPSHSDCQHSRVLFLITSLLLFTFCFRRSVLPPNKLFSKRRSQVHCSVKAYRLLRGPYIINSDHYQPRKQAWNILSHIWSLATAH